MKSGVRAAVFESVGKLVVKEVDSPRIQNGDELTCEVEVCSGAGVKDSEGTRGRVPACSD